LENETPLHGLDGNFNKKQLYIAPSIQTADIRVQTLGTLTIVRNSEQLEVTVLIIGVMHPAARVSIKYWNNLRTRQMLVSVLLSTLYNTCLKTIVN
jgi:hypothetical protein